MPDPQLENGYTRIANEILDALISSKLSGQDLRVALLIIRKTYGFGKIEDAISLSQMMEATGMCKVRCSVVVNRLQLMKILTVNENVNGLTKRYIFNKHLQEWGTVNENINGLRKHEPQKKVYISINNNIKNSTKNSNAKKREITLDDKEVFAAWNAADLIVHSDLAKHKSAIQSALKHNPKEDILTAIMNYSTVYHDPDCYWTHKWVLKDFLNRGLDRFLPKNYKLKDFLTVKGGTSGANRRPFQQRGTTADTSEADAYISSIFSNLKEKAAH